MERKYRTSHRGIAAYMTMRGYEILRVESGTNSKNKPCTYFEFDIDPATGRILGDEFYNGQATGNLKAFDEASYAIFNRIREARQ